MTSKLLYFPVFLLLIGLIAVPTVFAEDKKNKASKSSEAQNDTATVQSRTELSDENIAGAVRKRIGWDSGLASEEIRVTVADGTVVLEGEVATLTEKQRAAILAKSRKGVEGVDNNLSVEGSPEAEADLRQRVLEAIEDDNALSRQEISVDADGGTVILSGTVKNKATRGLAEEVVGETYGAREVDNGLEVATGAATRSDEEIRGAVQGRIKTDAWLDPEHIDVAVDEAVVTLTGTVASAEQKDRAERRASIEGVKDVEISGLKVEPTGGTPPAVAERRRENQDGKPVGPAEPGFRKMMSDSEIKDAVQAFLIDAPRLENTDLEVEVENSIVTLTGTVSGQLAKKVAEQEASGVFSVRDVRNEIQVESPDGASGKSLEEKARKAIARNATLEDQKIEVAVKDTTVTLSGTVDTSYQKNKAETVMAGLSGVEYINNKLKVEEGEPAGYTYFSYFYSYPDAFDWADQSDAGFGPDAAPTGSELAEEVRDELFWSWFVDSDAIEVDVEGGNVILEGTVEDKGEKDAAGKNAFDAGADTVDNRLEIAQQ